MKYVKRRPLAPDKAMKQRMVTRRNSIALINQTARFAFVKGDASNLYPSLLEAVDAATADEPKDKSR